MTAAEACELVVDLAGRLSAARAETHSWRLLALVLSRHSAELTRELEMIDQRQYISRTRTQDSRDLWIDQMDLRREAA